MDLVEQYKVSRHTIRQALRELRQTGMIDSGRGRSPRVTRNSEVTQPQGALYSLFASVEAQGHRQTSTVRFLEAQDRKSTRLNSSHVAISYAVFCLKKKTTMMRRLSVRSS